MLWIWMSSQYLQGLGRNAEAPLPIDSIVACFCNQFWQAVSSYSNTCISKHAAESTFF